ncbi:sulfatase-like hydrolase/transferase [Actinotalea sp. K2]|nr:sulfatase-like hydrolase/transferase [Actinotalea sp. K2]
MTDQQRAGFTTGSGFDLDTMPFTDGLADEGLRFSGAYTSAPACVPARTSLLTGRFPSSHKVTQNSNAAHAFYAQDMLDVLRLAGYRLSFSGKPHMHRLPEDFDFYGGPYFHTEGPARTRLEREFDAWLESLDHGVATEPTPFPLECQLPYRIVDQAIEALDAGGEQPQFLWVSVPEPHNPYQVPEPYFSMFAEDEVPPRTHGPEAARAKGGHWLWLQELIQSKRPDYDAGWRRYRANYCGALRMIDDQVRRLVEHARAELDGPVLVVMLSDHGDYAGEYGLQRKGVGLPEALVRIPMFFHGDGVDPHQVRSELVSLVDILPTICEVVGIPIPDGVQGRSLQPLLQAGPAPAEVFSSIYAERGYGGETYGPEERPPLHFPYEGPSFDELNTVTQSGASRMVRRGDHKLVVHSNGEGELYNLRSDPTEVVDLFNDEAHRQVRDELTWLLLHWMLRLQDTLPRGVYEPKTPEHNWYTMP